MSGRNLRLIALWRKLAADRKLSGNARCRYILLLAETDGLFYQGYNDGTRVAGNPPKAAIKRVRTLINKLLKQSTKSGRSRTVARCVNMLSCLDGFDAPNLYRPNPAPVVISGDTSTESLLERVAAITGNNGRNI